MPRGLIRTGEPAGKCGTVARLAPIPASAPPRDGVVAKPAAREVLPVVRCSPCSIPRKPTRKFRI
jgi:hypothetical protein